jgi:hypothetical protein
MPRDNDKNNDSRGRRDRPGGGKGRAGGGKSRSGAARGPEKKFAKRGFAGKSDGDGERRPYAGKSDGPRSFGKKPYAGAGKPYAGKRDGGDRPPRRDFGDAPRPRFNRDDRPRGDRPDRGERKDFRPREDRDGEKRSFKRVEIARTLIVMIAPRAGIATVTAETPVRRRALPRRNLATSGRIRRVVKVFVRTAIARVGLVPLVRDRT